MAQLTKRQTTTLRSLAAQYLPGGDDGYRSFLWETFPGKDWGDPSRPSTLDLTKAEANKAIRALLRLKRSLKGLPAGDGRAGKRPPIPAGYGAPYEARYEARGGLSQKQADELARLEWELDWHEDPSRLEGMIERILGEAVAPGQCSKAQATRCITVLRKMAG